MSPSSPTPSSHRPLSHSHPEPSSSESPSTIRKPDLTLVYLINHLDSFDSPDDDMQASATDIIPGSAPSSIKEAAVRWYSILDGGAIAHAGGRRTTRTFGQSVRPKVEIVEVSLEPSVDDPLNVGMRMVCELDVTPDMCDLTGVLSHGCMTFLMDEGSAISLLLLRLIDDETQRIGVSQTFNFVFHHPPPSVGSRIRIVSRSISAQRDIGCCQCEIWDTEKHKLIISGQQLQMQPSMPQPRKSKL